MHHSGWDSSGLAISSSQRPLPDNAQHSQQRDIHAAGGIRTHNVSRRTAYDLDRAAAVARQVDTKLNFTAALFSGYILSLWTFLTLKQIYKFNVYRQYMCRYTYIYRVFQEE